MTRGVRIGLVAMALALVAAGGLWRASKARCFALAGEVVCRVETTRKIVALSFDDGPTPEGVEEVLRELEPRGIRATFFLIGKHIERHPEAAARLTAAGMELGNHSFSHRRMIFRTAGTYDAEIARTDALLRAAGARRPSLLRPPFGKRLWGFPLAAERAGYGVVMWDVEDDAEAHPDPRDYARDILERVRPGSIILIHPMYRHSTTARRALPLILDGLAARGYRVTTVSDLLVSGAR